MHSETKSLNSQNSAKLNEIARQIHDLGKYTSCTGPESPAKSFNPSEIEVLQRQMSQLSMAKVDVAKEQEILKSLSFESRSTRCSSIPEAHHRTFRWVFEKPSSQTEMLASGNLLEWLQKGDGFFWVSGKPGSGKSTFLKFVTEHPQTLHALSTWSFPKPAIVVRHFFWSAGTPMQKSWQGLLQTLLYEIFRQLPDLIEPTCTERWLKRTEQLSHEAWYLPELRKILQRIADRQDLPAKFCFLIDGLDEFEGDHLEFCGVLKGLSKSPHVKFCVSSRPWNVFEDSFGCNIRSKLYMNELTRRDIRSYVESMLQEHPRWNDLKIDMGNAEWIINQITERATGVFLWVFMVTRQLRNGLTEYDSLSDMRRRLEKIPTDLGTSFKQILDSVEPFYHEKMATTLQIALAARQPAPTAVYHFHDEEYEDEDYALKLPLQPMNRIHAESVRLQVTRRLNGRCRGLLEVHHNRVEFLHRTVMDYLRSPEMSKYLNQKAPTRFNLSLSILRAFTAYIKSTQFPEFVDRTGFATYTESGLMYALQEALTHANRLGENLAAYELLDQLAYCIPEMHKAKQAFLNVWGNSQNPVSLFFWEPVISASLINYLHYVLPRLPRYFPELKTPAEFIMIFSVVVSLASTSEPCKQLAIISHLLDAGSHPNDTYCYSVPFRNALTQCAMDLTWKDVLLKAMPSSLTLAKPGSLSHKSLDTAPWKLKWTLESGLLALILANGGDPNAVNYWQPLSESTPVWVNFVLLSFCVPPHYHCHLSYLQNLDALIEARADMRCVVHIPCVGRSQPQSKTGLQLFLEHLCQTPAEAYSQLDLNLLCRVVERLLIMVIVADMNVHDYWPMLEKAFPPETVSVLKRKCQNGRLGKFEKSQSSTIQTQKRALIDSQGEEVSRKKFRSTLSITELPL